MQSLPINTKVVSLNPDHGEVYSIQHYVINCVRNLRQFGGFLGVLVSNTNKTDRHDITDRHDKTDRHDITDSHDITGILLKVA